MTSLLGAKMGLPFPEAGILPDRPLSHFLISLWWGGGGVWHCPGFWNHMSPWWVFQALLLSFVLCALSESLYFSHELGMGRKKDKGSCIQMKLFYSCEYSWLVRRKEGENGCGAGRGLFPFRSPCKREGMARNLGTAWACPLSPWCHMVEWENCYLWLIQMKVNICPGITVC